MTNVREAFLDISFFSFFKKIQRTGRGKYFFSNMQEEKGPFKSPSTTLNFITLWYILVSCKDWVRKSEKLIPWLNVFFKIT